MNEDDLGDWLVFTKLRLLAVDKHVHGARLRRPHPNLQLWSVREHESGFVTVAWVPADLVMREEVHGDPAT